VTMNVNKGLVIGYKRRPVATVIEDLSFREGQVSLLLGLNGTGKTTLMKTLAGLLPPVSGAFARSQVLYLSDELDFPANLTPSDIISCLDAKGRFRQLGREMLASLQVENKNYGVLSRGNRQKARIAFGEIVSRARNVNILGLDEPFAGLDFQAKDYLVGRWMEKIDQDLHLLVSMHPSEIPVQPTQIIIVTNGEISTVPPMTSWPEIRMLLQKPQTMAE
jgi:ABC-type multidrug transport system ATPase subunit